MNARSLWDWLPPAGQRRAAHWLARHPFALPPGRPMVSFTFDDFPRSALDVGGAKLERLGLAGTYYVSLGLSGQSSVSGELFALSDLSGLLARGHELGCHTYDHCPAWTTGTPVFEASVLRNRQALHEWMPGAQFSTLSYPISYPRPGTKKRMAGYFSGCRGGGQRFNTGTIDLNYLSAFFLEQSRDPEAVKRIMLANHAAGGWLIFATHDISPTPSRYGCTPAFFEQVVRFAVDSGAEVLPVGQALSALSLRRPSRA